MGRLRPVEELQQRLSKEARVRMSAHRSDPCRPTGELLKPCHMRHRTSRCHDNLLIVRIETGEHSRRRLRDQGCDLLLYSVSPLRPPTRLRNRDKGVQTLLCCRCFGIHHRYSRNYRCDGLSGAKQLRVPDFGRKARGREKRGKRKLTAPASKEPFSVPRPV